MTPWQASGPWLRCALHAHTTNSDGELAPRMLVKHYERAGYDVLAITDHWHRTEAPSGRVLVIPGAELNCLLPAGRDGHVLALGVDADPGELGERLDLAGTAGWIVAHGGVAYLAHPYWTGATPGTLELPAEVSGIEVYNAGCELEIGRGLSAVHWDELLAAGHACHAIAADDTHHPGFDSDLAWTWVRAERSAEAVLEALRSGCFYASTGPLLTDVRVGDGAVEVECSPCRSVTLLTGVSSGAAVHAGRLGYSYAAEIVDRTHDGLITAARLVLPETAPYARVEVVDAAGKTAWSNRVA
ncbi:PHP domain-containing protein [Gaiella occulta]|uniref:PHP domain-containing protein n=1 Tax=Gaiella occulta TaxID=1002870 RepID=A0A7M2Z136_9ACTN|nr:CehA/McbA family metallohydrolase [Gaiella occulta]RDI76128.1 PHP domain-containing protein [Gaiella occulta]